MKLYGWMMMSGLATACLTAGVLMLYESRAQAQEVQPLRVLLITGGGWHDYEEQKHVLEEGISRRANVVFTVDHEIGDQQKKLSRHEDDAWSRDFDVVVYNMCITTVTDPDYVKGVIEAHVEHRLPAVMLHCACHSYSYDAENPGWWEFTGAHTQRHQAHMAYTVEVTNADHPILAYFPDEWQTPHGELYNIEAMMPTANVLAHAFGEGRGEYEPNIWTNDYRGVPVFTTTIGHHSETMSDANYLNLVTSGLLWVAGKLEYDGEPAQGYAAEHWAEGFE